MSFVLAANLLTPNAGVIFWTAVAFGLLLLLLAKYAWKPITSALEEREKTIESSITRAERALAEARELQATNETARREADRQAQTILREARETADRIRTEDVERTKAEIQRMQAQASADLDRQKQQAMADLRSQVATLALDAAGKLLGENLNDERQHRLVDRFIAEIPQRAS